MIRRTYVLRNVKIMYNNMQNYTIGLGKQYRMAVKYNRITFYFKTTCFFYPTFAIILFLSKL